MFARSIRPALAGATSKLEAAGVPSPAVDADLLLAHVLGIERSRLALTTTLTDQQLGEYENLVSRRAQREPLQYLTGEAYFRYLTLQVGPGVFVPRPETETLVDLALAELSAVRAGNKELSPVVVDLCTGSAAIPLAIATEFGGVRASAVEYASDALIWADRNVTAHAAQLANVGSTVDLFEGDACGAAALLAKLVGQVDVLTCNPPYIPSGAIPRDPEVRDFDPDVGLYGGVDGLEVVRAVVEQAAILVRSGGLLLIEHGDEQGEVGGPLGVPAVVRASVQFAEVTDHPDLGGRPRTTSARKA